MIDAARSLPTALAGAPPDRVTAALLFLLVLGLAASITVAQGTLLLLTVWLLVRHTAARPMRWPLLGALLAFVAWTVLSVAASDAPERSLRALRGLVWLGTPYVVLGALDDTAAARRFLMTLAATLAVVSAAAVVQVLGCPAAPQELPAVLAEFFRRCDRAHGFFSIYMTLGGVLMLGLVAVLPAAPRRGLRRAGFLVGWAVGAVALALTFVRGAWLGFGLGVIVVSLAGRRRALALAALAAGALVLLALLPGVLERARTIGDMRDATTLDRLAMLEAGLSMVAVRPVFGVGVGQVRDAYPDHAPAYALRRSRSHLHNSPLQVAAERGLPGLALWIAVFGGFFLRTRRILAAVPPGRDDARALVLGSIAAVAAFLVAGLFEYNFGDSEVWLVAAAIMALPFVVERELERG